MTDLELHFRIDAWEPDTLPMARLAEYMKHLAELFGEVDQVHFVQIAPGSAVLVQRAEQPAYPKIISRIGAINLGAPAPDAIAAFKKLDDMLAKDNAVGSLTAPAEGTGDYGAEILHFPGRDRPPAVRYGPINQPGTVEGILMRLGGRDETVPVVILRDDGLVVKCNATRALAREIAVHLLSEPLRLTGQGRWYREQDGTWSLERFNISSFEVLPNAPLSQVFAELQAVPGNGWADLEDASSQLAALRLEERH